MKNRNKTPMEEVVAELVQDLRAGVTALYHQAQENIARHFPKGDGDL